MTNGELDALLDDLRQSTPLKRLTTPGAARAVFLTLLSKGYDLVKPQPGDKRKLVESDIEQHEIVKWLRDTTPLGALAYPEAQHVFGWLNGTGYRIAKPDRHPSGLKTTEQAHTDVKALGKGSHVRTIDRQNLPDGPISIFNGGESE